MEEEGRLSGYELSRHWFDFCFENPEKIKPNHTALYFFAIEHCNRLGWKKKFGLPSSMAMEAIGIKSYNTYKSTLDDLVNWGFILMVQVSKNQYSSNIVALSNLNKALDKALDKALLKHTSKQSESTRQSIYSIDKPFNNETIEQINHEQEARVSENLNEESKQVFDALLVRFGITEMKNFRVFRMLHGFVSFMQSRNQMTEFIEQANAYWTYKEKSGDKTHGPAKYTGTIENHFQDGAWCAENWKHKLENFKPHATGNKQSAVEKREQDSKNRSAELAELMEKRLRNQNSKPGA